MNWVRGADGLLTILISTILWLQLVYQNPQRQCSDQYKLTIMKMDHFLGYVFKKETF